MANYKEGKAHTLSTKAFNFKCPFVKVLKVQNDFDLMTLTFHPTTYWIPTSLKFTRDRFHTPTFEEKYFACPVRDSVRQASQQHFQIQLILYIPHLGSKVLWGEGMLFWQKEENFTIFPTQLKNKFIYIVCSGSIVPTHKQNKFASNWIGLPIRRGSTRESDEMDQRKNEIHTPQMALCVPLEHLGSTSPVNTA